MRSGTRLPERWFNRALWLVALVFAACLIGLGSLIVDDLPAVEQPFTLDQFLDKTQADASATALANIHRAQDDNQRRTAEAQLSLGAARAASANAQDTFANWLKTRDATQRVDQDPGLIERTRKLDELKAAERTIEEQMAGLAKSDLDLSERLASQTQIDDALRTKAEERLEAANSRQELRVFGYRLAFTLPLLLLAGWLLAKKRQTRNWPFVWGFALATAFAFFVELAPYVPSYGGYVQYGVGLVITLVAGRAAIQALHRYMERQRAEEARPKDERRNEIATDVALVRLSKKVCPGCERPIDLTDTRTNFCPHCGLGVFERCPSCGERKSTFDRFCCHCGQKTVRAVEAPVVMGGAA